MANISRTTISERLPISMLDEPKSGTKTYRVTLKGSTQRPLVSAHAVNMNFPFVFFLLSGEAIDWFNAAEVVRVEIVQDQQ